MKKTLIIISLLIYFTACNQHTPRPQGYPRIERQQVEYIKYESPYFSFLHPSDTRIEEVGKEHVSGFWFNILYPEHDARIYCTYLPVNKVSLKKALDDSYQLAYSHTSKAEGISQFQYQDSALHKTAIIYDVKGSVAAPVQFYVTDNTSHILRGSLYYNQPVSVDSVAPVSHFIKEDIIKIIESIQWKNIAK